jgi:Phage major capsid protein E
MPTEAPAEIYRTSSILAGMENVPRASVFLRDKLFSKVVTVPSDQVDISFYKGKAKLAPYCSRFSAGTAVPREREQLRLFSPPFMKPVKTLAADDVFYRSMGGAGADNDNRDAQLLARDILELDADISRREEWMVSRVLFDGKVICLDGDTSEIVAEIDYTPISSSLVSPLWSAASTCDPLKDLKTAMRLVSGACGYSADLIVMGKDASDGFENADKVLAAYDKRNIAPGEITPALAEYGITLLGNYRGLPIYASESQYTDVDGTSKYFVPADKVLVAASGLQGTLAYAGIVQVDESESSMKPYEGARLPLVYYERGFDFRKVRLSSRPIPIPADTTSWTILDVI